MKIISLFISLLIFCNMASGQQTIEIRTEHYPPFNYDRSLVGEGEGVGGVATEVILELMKRSGYTYSLDLVSWQRAIGGAKDVPYNAVYSIVRTPEREPLFKWVGPIAENDYVLLGNVGDDIVINSLEDAKNYTIGVYRGSAGEANMKNAGMTIDAVRSDHLNVLKLKRNRIDLWVAGHLYATNLAKQYGVTGLEKFYTLETTPMYIAFNPETPDTVIDKIQTTLDEMEQEGVLDNIYNQYK